MMNGEKDETNQALIAESREEYGAVSGGDSASDDDSLDEESPLLDSKETAILSYWEIIAKLSTAFAYGCILTTLFLITLPLECARIQHKHPSIPKSVSLGIFVAIAGITQLISPLTGMLSDTYKPPTNDVGQRLPYLVLGSILTVIGLLAQILSSERAFWLRYSFAFFLHMIGLNIVYSMMIALIPDQVPPSQTGTANGILALLLVTGSLFGFALFHSILYSNIESMYGLYVCIVIFTTIMTCFYASDQDVALAQERRRQSQRSQPLQRRRRRRHVLLSPALLLRTMIYDPLRQLDWNTLLKSYTIDATRYHDFFIVTVSRTFYYMGISVQTFFLYFIHDIIHIHNNPESSVALLAILGQCSGAFTCFPVGLLSDKVCGGRRKPFVYLACIILSASMIALLFCTTMQQVTIIGLVLGGANGMYLTMDTSLAVDTLPKGGMNGVENADGNSETAQLLGVWGVAGFIGSALGPLLGGPLLYLVGHDEDITGDESSDSLEEYSIYGYAVIICLSAFYFLVSAFLLRYVHDERGCC